MEKREPARLCLHVSVPKPLPLAGLAPDYHWTGPHLWVQGPCEQWVDSWHLTLYHLFNQKRAAPRIWQQLEPLPSLKARLHLAKCLLSGTRPPTPSLPIQQSGSG